MKFKSKKRVCKRDDFEGWLKRYHLKRVPRAAVLCFSLTAAVLMGCDSSPEQQLAAIADCNKRGLIAVYGRGYGNWVQCVLPLNIEETCERRQER